MLQAHASPEAGLLPKNELLAPAGYTVKARKGLGLQRLTEAAELGAANMRR